MSTAEDFRQKIKKALALAKQNGYTQAKVGEEAGVSPQAVGQWKTGKVSNEKLAILARLAGKTIDWFYTEPTSFSVREKQDRAYEDSIARAPTSKGMCPEISWVAAGQWAEVLDVNLDPDSTNWYPRPPGASDQTFVLRVVGESMAPEYPPGRLIFVDPEIAPHSHDDVVAVMTDSNEATFKRLVEEPGSPRMLKALNPAWNNPYLEINGNCQIIGVVIADMRMRQR